MIIYQEVEKRLKEVEKSVSVLKQTVDRRVYDPIIDNAISVIELDILTFNSYLDSVKEK